MLGVLYHENMPFLFTDKWAYLQLPGAVDEGILFKCVARAGGNGSGWARGEKAVTRDDYLIVLLDMQNKYEALGKAIYSMNNALMAGCFTDPQPAPVNTSPRADETQRDATKKENVDGR